ncbi:hypothetical protein OIV83_004414 [Microbotryomycetes sp. JL201]|nr:hypothetical protein OIV83_004414 [Microbotryomycetes sp. JL201]
MVQTIKNRPPPSEVDVIICGGGAAGCVVAGRLAQADPNLQIAVIESGINNKGVATSEQPALYISHLAPDSTTAHFWAAKESKDVNGRACIVPSGGLLGGGSSLNFLMYTRGSKSDYDDWDTEGWTYDDILPLARKMETYHPSGANPKLHGNSGPLHVSEGGYRSALADEFLEATKKCYDVPYTDDLQDFKTGHGVTKWQKWINPKTGRRSDAANGYVHPVVEKQDNLHVICESRTVRVLFDDSTPPRAIGVEYCANPLATAPLNPEQPPKADKIETMKARKYVVVSAGALGTPGVLERSGVGNKEILKKAGVECKVELDGVGAEYQDHQLALGIVMLDDNADTADEYLRGNPEVHAKVGPQWAETGKGLVATNHIDAGMKMRPTEDELDQMEAYSPGFKEMYNRDYRDKPDKPLMFGGLVSTFLGDHSLLPPGKRFGMLGAFSEYPLSRGSVHITSSDPFAAPDFDAGFCKEQHDVAPHIWAWKVLREIARRMPSYRGELAGPEFPEGSAAKCLNEEEAIALTKSGNIKDIEYTKEDDAAIEKWVRQNIGTTWHSMATCPMKPKEKGGVVDKRLNVYGTQGLKLADLSICPSNMGSNTYSVALTVGEKAAVLLGEDLGIKV